jgi:hypothetical protein
MVTLNPTYTIVFFVIEMNSGLKTPNAALPPSRASMSRSKFRRPTNSIWFVTGFRNWKLLMSSLAVG